MDNGAVRTALAADPRLARVGLEAHPEHRTGGARDGREGRCGPVSLPGSSTSHKMYYVNQSLVDRPMNPGLWAYSLFDFNSLRMPSSASMISLFPTLDLLKLNFRLKDLLAGLNANTYGLGRPGLSFAVSARTA